MSVFKILVKNSQVEAEGLKQEGYYVKCNKVLPGYLLSVSFLGFNILEG